MLDSKWRDSRDGSVFYVSRIEGDWFIGNTYLNGYLQQANASHTMEALEKFFERLP